MNSPLLDFLRSKKFLYNALGALAIAVVFFLFIQSWLGGYTHHGESITVPDVRGMSQERMERFLEDNSLKSLIVDSLFEMDKKPGTVLEQDPAPNSKVKEGRTIYITINSGKPPKVKMPLLTDVSYRQAEAILLSYGLKVGQIIYQPDLAKNAVLDQLYHGNHIDAGRELNKGSVIDLVLGDGMGNTEIPVPDLTGSTRSEALFVLKGSSLNVGSIVFDAGVKDTLNAKVYRQIPAATEGAVLSQGEAVNIYLH
jgi:beta-lactam-binding protein with PASTA domain